MAKGSPLPGGPDASHRRSQRVILSLAVTIRTEGAAPASKFEEETRTLVVNLHGALILLKGKVARDQKLRLTNRATQQEQICRVVFITPTSGGEIQVGIEFLKPAPDFWHIAFPPEDWVLPESSTTT